MGRVAASQPAFDTELFRFLSEDLLKAVQPEADSIGNADIGVVYGVRDDALQTAMEINLFQFSAAKTLAELQELNRLFRESSNFADFEREARKICTAFNRDWQRTEYDTALLTAEAASTYRRLMGKTKLFPYWEYRRSCASVSSPARRDRPSLQRCQMEEDLPAERLAMSLPGRAADGP